MKVSRTITKWIMGTPIKIKFIKGELPHEKIDDALDENMSVKGRYYSTKQVVLVSDDLPKERKQLILYHELIHCYDDLLRLRDDGTPITDAECDRIALMIQDILGD